jgi:hypothetical protein
VGRNYLNHSFSESVVQREQIARFAFEFLGGNHCQAFGIG